MPPPTLWEPDTSLHTITDIHPQLASWDKVTHPSQIRLQAYRQRLMDGLLPLLSEGEPLFLHLEVDVQKQEYKNLTDACLRHGVVRFFGGN